jgi:hypothetical protein
MKWTISHASTVQQELETILSSSSKQKFARDVLLPEALFGVVLCS